MRRPMWIRQIEERISTLSSLLLFNSLQYLRFSPPVLFSHFGLAKASHFLRTWHYCSLRDAAFTCNPLHLWQICQWIKKREQETESERDFSFNHCDRCLSFGVRSNITCLGVLALPGKAGFNSQFLLVACRLSGLLATPGGCKALLISRN